MIFTINDHDFNIAVEAVKIVVFNEKLRVKRKVLFEITANALGFKDYNSYQNNLLKTNDSLQIKIGLGDEINDFEKKILASLNIHLGGKVGKDKQSEMALSISRYYIKISRSYSFSATKNSIDRYINEIDLWLPDTEDFDLPQSEFIALFSSNIIRIENRLASYVINQCQPDLRDIINFDDQHFKAVVRNSVKNIVITPLVQTMDLLAEPKNIKVLKENEWLELYTPAIKINNATGNLILQQMNLYSYKVFKNELFNIDLNTIDHITSRIYDNY